MKCKIVYVLSHPLVERDYIRYGIKYMLDNTIAVDVIDAFDLFWPSKDRTTIQAVTDKVGDIYYVRTIRQLLNKLQSYEDPIRVVLITSVDRSFYQIVSQLNVYKIPVATIRVGAIPLPLDSIGGTFLIRLKVMFERGVVLGGFKKMYHKIRSSLYQMGEQARLDFVFYGGAKALSQAPRIIKEAEHKISVHTLDYDLLLSDVSSSNRKPYILFLDQFLPHHPDVYLASDRHEMVGVEIVDQYYACLNSFFSMLEEQHGCCVVVAAHPRSDYTGRDERFQGREVIRDSVTELVKHSKICVTYCSTAVNLAVLFGKPLVFIYMDSFNSILGGYTRAVAEAMAHELSGDFWLIDKEYIENREISVNKEAYLRYIDNYIKEYESVDGLFWEEVLKRLIYDEEVICT